METQSQAVMFYNFSSVDFAHTWSGEMYSFKGFSRTYLPKYLALHFAKHLAQREILTEKNGEMVSQKEDRFKQMMAKAILSDTEVSASSNEKLALEMMNQSEQELEVAPQGSSPFAATPVEEKVEEVVEKKKPGRPKKVVEEKFEGLDEAAQ